MRTKDPPAAKGARTRRKIVAAAAPIFNQRGYDGSSLSDLMAATGLKKGGIYRHFAGKEELAAEAFDYAWEAAWTARSALRKFSSGHVDINQAALWYARPSLGLCLMAAR